MESISVFFSIIGYNECTLQNFDSNYKKLPDHTRNYELLRMSCNNRNVLTDLKFKR